MKNIYEIFPQNIDVSKDILRKSLVGPVVNVQGFGAQADGLNDDADAIAAAMAGALGMTLLFPPGRYRIGRPLTFPREISLYFLPGATLVPDSRVIITLYGVIEAGAFSIFDLNAEGAALQGSLIAPFILPQWFGAIANDPSAASRNVKAFQAAWAAFPSLNGAMLVPSGFYYVDDTLKFSDVANGRARSMYGAKFWGSGTIIALETIDFSGKALVHFEGVEVSLTGFSIDTARHQHKKSPAVGIAITRDENKKGGGIVGDVYISGAYTHASLYNLSCENCHIYNSTIINHGLGAILWDSSENMPGLSIGIEGESNTRKSFIGCNVLNYSHSETPVSLVLMGKVSEFSFENCYFAMDNGYVFTDLGKKGEIHNLLVRECRSEVNLEREQSVKDKNRLLYLTGNILNAEISYVYFASPSNSIIEIDGGAVNNMYLRGNDAGVGTDKFILEVDVNNGGKLSCLSGDVRKTIRVTNGSGKSVLDRSDLSSLMNPPIIGDGIYSISSGNRVFSKSGLYEKGPPRAQGELKALTRASLGDGRAFVVQESTAFYSEDSPHISWLTDTFSTHLISLFCAKGTMTIEHNVPNPPQGYRPIFLEAERPVSVGAGAIIMLQNGYGGWREVSRTTDRRSSVVWQPGGGNGLRPGSGETSPAIVLDGVSFGYFVRVAAPYDLNGAIVGGYVSGPNLVKIHILNSTSQSLYFEAGKWVVASDR